MSDIHRSQSSSILYRKKNKKKKHIYLIKTLLVDDPLVLPLCRSICYFTQPFHPINNFLSSESDQMEAN